MRNLKNILFLVTWGVLFKEAASYGNIGLCVFFICNAICSCVLIAINNFVLPLMQGSECLYCREEQLAYKGCYSFGHRFYECTRCGRMMKRRGPGRNWEPATIEELNQTPDLAPGILGRPLTSKWGLAREAARGIYALSLSIGLFLGGLLGYLIAGVGGFVALTLFSAWIFLDHLWKKTL